MPQAYGDRHDEAGATPLPRVLLLRRPLTPPLTGRLIWSGGQFIASRPNQLWVCDLTYLRTWVGFTYLALVIAVYSRCMVGWALTTHLRTDLPLEALKMAVWSRAERLDGLIHAVTDVQSQLRHRRCAVRVHMGDVAEVLDDGDTLLLSGSRCGAVCQTG